MNNFFISVIGKYTLFLFSLGFLYSFEHHHRLNFDDAPIGVILADKHKKGEWMLSCHFMQIKMNENCSGTKNMFLTDASLGYVINPINVDCHIPTLSFTSLESKGNLFSSFQLLSKLRCYNNRENYRLGYKFNQTIWVIESRTYSFSSSLRSNWKNMYNYKGRDDDINQNLYEIQLKKTLI